MTVLGDQPTDLVLGTEFAVFTNGGSGNVTGNVYKVPNLGCNASDWTSFPAGSIALVQRGTCTFTEKVQAAVTANARALILYNTGATGNTGLFSANTGYANGSPIPVLSMSFDLGNALSFFPNLTMSISLNAATLSCNTANIIAGTFSKHYFISKKNRIYNFKHAKN